MAAMENQTVVLPPQTRAVLDKLNECGCQAYAVGGCVRDALMGKTPHDWDVCTSATPEEVEACFAGERLIETGLKHGTVTLLQNGQPFEITTFRTEGSYTDHRRPDSVSFVDSLELDLSRRDFTINAMAFHPETGLVDLFGGKEDLNAGLIRCVGQPEQRFREDGLRILRALRFASRLGFAIEEKTAGAVHGLKELLRCISPERIFSEVKGILLGAGAGELLRTFPDVFFVILPELEPMDGLNQHSPSHCWDVWTHTTYVVDAAPQSIELRLAALFHDCGKPSTALVEHSGTGHFYGHGPVGEEIARTCLNRLRCDHQTRDVVLQLVRLHDRQILPEKKALRRLVTQLGPERVRQLLELSGADTKAKAPARMPQVLERIHQTQALLEDLLSQEDCFRISDLAVNGRDLLDLGYPRGSQLGQALNTLLEAVLDETVPNEKAALLNLAAQNLPKEQGRG